MLRSFVPRRPPALENQPPRLSTTPPRGGSIGLRAKSRGASTAGSLTGVDLEQELEHVHSELRNFLQKKRARKAGAGGCGGTPSGGGGAGLGKGAQVKFTYVCTTTVSFFTFGSWYKPDRFFLLLFNCTLVFRANYLQLVWDRFCSRILGISVG